MKSVKEDNYLVVKADKSTNFYRMKPCDYKDLVDKNIQKSYKKANKGQEARINKDAKAIAEELDLSDRIETMTKRDAFITLKDHKPNFNNAPTCRLINPTKSEIGRISKEILQKIVKSVAISTNVNLWRSTQSVLEWFNAIENKQNAAFICFDIVDFYPSITEKLLSEAIDFASEYVDISHRKKDYYAHKTNTAIQPRHPMGKERCTRRFIQCNNGVL